MTDNNADGGVTILPGEPEIQQRQFFRQPLDAIELNDVGPAEYAGEIGVAAGIEPDAEQVDALMTERQHRAPGVLDEITAVGDIDVRRFAVAHQQQKLAVRMARGEIATGMPQRRSHARRVLADDTGKS